MLTRTGLNPVCRIDPLPSFPGSEVSAAVLRLDELHPVVSGNKWFKLQYYLADAVAGHKTLLTFGGAYSNHIVATAAAARHARLKSIGIIRGEKPVHLSHTLQAAEGFGMKLHFTSRSDYRQKIVPAAVWEEDGVDTIYTVPEGGYGAYGVQGAMDILRQNNTEDYTHLLAAVGTGTTLAGIVLAARADQKVTGIPVLKNEATIRDEINDLLPPERRNGFELAHRYHFGGYAKSDRQLLSFMNSFFEQTGIATDFVYTAKAFFAAYDLAGKGYFPAGSRVLLMHTGGLQGNLSLPKGTLIF